MNEGARSFARRLGVAFPIIQAPMAGGPTTPALVAAVGLAGALGSLGAAMLGPRAISEACAAIRALGDHPFLVNLFVLPPADPTPEAIARALPRLAPFHEELGLPPPAIPNSWGEDLEAQVDAVLAARPAAVGTHFGPPPPRLLAGCRARGILVMSTATTPGEARVLEAAGVDAVVAQGAEAGGHRGSFLRPVEESLVGTMALVPAMVDAVRIPVVAAGGIMDGRGVAAALALGASAVQLGTAFLACPEAGTHPLHKAALASAEGTLLTRGVTGRHARGLRNRLLVELDASSGEAPDYLVQSTLSGPLRAAAARQGRPELMAMWAGQGHAMARAEPAGDLVARLAREAGLVAG